MKSLIKAPFLFALIIVIISAAVIGGGAPRTSSTTATEEDIEIIQSDGDFVGPFKDKNYTITSDVGNRAIDGMHMGIDLSAGYGADVIALSDGIVFKASNTCDPNGGYLGNYCPWDVVSGGGNYVVVKFAYQGKEYYAQYDHMSNIRVQTGDVVKKGQVIGAQGNSGNSTGSHLHLEIHHGGLYTGSTINWVSPRFFLEI